LMSDRVVLKVPVIKSLFATGDVLFPPGPPGSIITPLARPSSSPRPPSVMFSMRTLSPSRPLVPSSEVALIQVVELTFQYCTGAGRSAGYVWVMVMVWPTV